MKKNKPIVCGAILEKNKKILLVNPIIRKGLWNMPAGHKKKNETLKQAAIREILEETGFQVKLIKLISTNTGNDYITKVWQAKIISGILHFPKDEITSAKWFTIPQALKLKLTNSTKHSILDYQQGKFYNRHLI